MFQVRSGVQEANLSITYNEHLLVVEIGIAILFAAPHIETDKSDPRCVINLGFIGGSAQARTGERIDNVAQSLAFCRYVDQKCLLIDCQFEVSDELIVADVAPEDGESRSSRNRPVFSRYS